MNREVLLTFETPHDAIRAEGLLLDGGFCVKVMSLPAAIRAGCGLCLRLPPEDARRAAAVLAGGGVGVERFYTRRPGTDGGAAYAEWENA